MKNQKSYKAGDIFYTSYGGQIVKCTAECMLNAGNVKGKTDDGRFVIRHVGAVSDTAKEVQAQVSKSMPAAPKAKGAGKKGR